MAFIRVQFFKKGVAKYISHLDMMRTIQRSVRRAGLPIEYSKGFNPHSKIAYGPALALGVSSDGEFLDMELKDTVAEGEFIKRLNACLPAGLGVTAAKYVPDEAKSLTAIINAAEYSITGPLKEPVQGVQQKIEDFFKSDSIFIERVSKRGRGRRLDIIPLISEIVAIKAEGQRVSIELIIDTGSSSNLRPTELVDALKYHAGLSFEYTDIHRKRLLIRRKGAYFTPLEVFN